VNRARAFAAGVALVAATAAVVWWLGSQQGLPGAVDPRSVPGAAAAPTGGAGQSLLARPMESSFFATRRASDPDRSEDPLLVHGLRDTLEALLTEALEDGATDPAALKQRLAALVGKHFPAALATR